MDNDFEIYTGKTFSQLCENIVDNQEEMKTQIDILVGELRPLIKTVNDAMIVVPLLKDYIDVGVKNNEHLIKLAAITNKIKSKYAESDVVSAGGFESIMTEDEKKEIAEHIRKVQDTQIKLKIEKSNLEDKTT